MPELFPLELDDYEVFTTLQLGQFIEITALTHYPGSNKPDFPAAAELAPWWTRAGDKTFTNYHDYAIYKMDQELDRRHKRRPDLTRERIFELMNGLDSDSIAYNLQEIANEPAPSKSTFFEHKGKTSWRNQTFIQWSIHLPYDHGWFNWLVKPRTRSLNV